MNKYYKIPMTERMVSINKRTLLETLQDNYPDLYDRERGRVELAYGGPEPGIMTPQLELEVENYNANTKQLYRAMEVPTHIIGIQIANGSIVEYVTGAELIPYGRSSILNAREVNQQSAYEFLDKEKNYSAVATKMFAKKEEPKSLFKRIKETVLGK